jgi:hypothetical protein
MPQCPICKSEAEEIDLGLVDGAGFSCKRHGEFRVAGSVFKESRAPPAEGERAHARRAQSRPWYPPPHHHL